MKDKITIPIKTANEKGFILAEDGDGVDISSRMEYHRGTVQKGMTQTLTTAGGTERGVVIMANNSKPKVIGGIGEKTSNNGTQWYQQKRVYDSAEIALCVDESGVGTNYVERERTDAVRIRRLTPRECWRLMGRTDEDFEKAEKVNSDSQLYKQAGNSIVVDVLVYLFGELFRQYPTEDK